uniref:Gag-Pol polyprotein n=1 Tax=Atrato Retro-like virus TaxID=2689360 RepID=A0A6B9KLA8_9VIRU|nr:Gag-Pol polyprotein [Atrato Retro-like virus]
MGPDPESHTAKKQQQDLETAPEQVPEQVLEQGTDQVLDQVQVQVQAQDRISEQRNVCEVMALQSGVNEAVGVFGRTNTQGMPAIERLKGRENWRTWKFAVRTYLEVEDLWEAIEPTPKEDGTPAEVNPRKDRIARGKIILLIDPVNYIHIEDVKTAAEVWKKLSNTFEDSGLTRQWSLLHKLITTNLANCVSMEAYVTRMIETANQLIGIGFPLTDKWIGMLLLAGLPDEYRPMVMGLENSGLEITGDFIKTKLLQETELVKAEPALISTQKWPHGRHNNPHTAKGKGPKCRRCEKFGHIAKYCRTKEPTNNHAPRKDAFNTVLSMPGTINREDWFFDSGCVKHLTNNRSILNDAKEVSGSIYAANKGKMSIMAEGSTNIKPTCSDKVLEVKNVDFVPELAVNLLSVSKITDKGHTVIFKQKGCKVVNPEGKVIATGGRENDLYKLHQNQTSVLACTGMTEKIWHQRMGHLNNGSLRKLKNGMANGVSYDDTNDENCEQCAVGKLTRTPFSNVGTRASEVLELVHSDICGPMEVTSLGGARYYLSFTDDKTRKIFVYFLRTKSQEEVLQKFKEFHVMAERQSGKKLKTLRTDNGWEYKNAKFENVLKQLGIRHQTSTEYTPEQNGLAERINRTVVERARCMLYEAKLPKSFWAEATATAVYLINRSPTRGVNTTPEEAWTNRKPNLAHIRVFGTHAMAHIPKQKRKKWDGKAEKCILVGYEEGTKGYRLYNVNTDTVFKSRDVIFINEGSHVQNQQDKNPEMVILDFHNEETHEVKSSGSRISNGRVNEEDDEEKSSGTFEDAKSEVSSSDDEVMQNEASEEASGNETRVLQESTARPVRSERNPPKRLLDYIVGLSANVMEPKTLEEALESAESSAWRAAMDEEINSHMKNGTWELTHLPPGKKAVGCRWVFKEKTNEKGEVIRHKARIVAQGHVQKYGIDYDEVFAPVTRHLTLRTLLTIAGRDNLVLKQLDIKTAYLYGDIEEEVYMKQPPGYVISGKESHVCRLRRSIYGLKQSARCWNKKLSGVLQKMGFTANSADPCLFIRIGNNRKVYLLVYVDDILIGSADEKEIKRIYEELQGHFEISWLGDPKYFLGLEITKDKESVYHLSAKTSIQKLIESVGMKDAKPTKTPMDTGYVKDTEKGKELEDISKYRSVVGSLMYVATTARPDIAASVSVLGRCFEKPTEKDWVAAKRVIRYLIGTVNWSLRLGGDRDYTLEAFSDSDWAGDHTTRKSTTGYILFYGGGAIAWTSRRQNCVTLSSMEAEYIALGETCQEVIWTRRLLEDMGEIQKSPTLIQEDNQGCLKFITSERISKRSKHIDTKACFVRDLVEKKIIKLNYCPTEDMRADILTKALGTVKHNHFSTVIGLREEL